jgi:hypothetical protein
MRRTGLALAVASTVLTASCSSDQQAQTTSAARAAGPPPLPRGSEPVELDPADFTIRIDNPYWPMTPGSRWVYRERDSEGNEQRVVVTVTRETKRIMGIEARVVHDVVTENGRLKEDTYDWYAQDERGNVWYLGEDTKEYEHGKVSSTEGSWEAGVDGAQPGVIVPARPKVGLTYREEYYEGKAEDAAQVLSVDERVTVPYGSFGHVVMTKNFTPLDPNVLEHKFYARRVGPVLAISVSGGSDREELVRFAATG